MKKWLDEFLSKFHKKYTKELGFRKVRRTFSRDKGEYFERFNFQSSMSNVSGVENWKFYFNVGVEFKDLEPRKNWSLFPNTHWSDRLGIVLKTVPSVWEYNKNTDKDSLAKKLNEVILEASQKISKEIEGLRMHYIEGKHLEIYFYNK